MIISAEVFLTGLTGPWALIEFGYLFWFGMFDWTFLVTMLDRNMWEHFDCCLMELCVMRDDWFIDLYVIIMVEM